LDATRDLRPQTPKIFQIPSIENFGFCFESTVADEGVVNGGACDTASGSLDGAKHFLCVQGDQCQPLANLTQKQ
jgi:hypothetical protein